MSNQNRQVPAFLGQAIAMWRAERGMTLRELARNADVRPPHVSRIENGKALPSLPVLFRIAQALDIHPGILLVSDADAMSRTQLMGSLAESMKVERPPNT